MLSIYYLFYNPEMGFLEARIKYDLESLTIPIRYTFSDNIIFFTLNVDSPLYKKPIDFKLVFPESYPFKSPKLTCLHKIYHPNIDLEGHVCLKVLREGWTPAYDLNSIIVSLIYAFHDISGQDALNTEAGLLFEHDPVEYERKVLEYERLR